jgi:2-dehydro-3-deoxyphosphogluconate aldolase/(4S)-4-hydroxy-2-oxoglutarate aldolase
MTSACRLGETRNRAPASTAIRAVAASTALEHGADAVKLFPASAFGPGWLADVRAAVPQAPIMPTGGVRVDDVPAWIEAGAVACGMGAGLTAGGPDAAAQRVRALLERVSAIRS